MVPYLDRCTGLDEAGKESEIRAVSPVPARPAEGGEQAGTRIPSEVSSKAGGTQLGRAPAVVAL